MLIFRPRARLICDHSEGITNSQTAKSGLVHFQPSFETFVRLTELCSAFPRPGSSSFQLCRCCCWCSFTDCLHPAPHRDLELQSLAIYCHSYHEALCSKTRTSFNISSQRLIRYRPTSAHLSVSITTENPFQTLHQTSPISNLSSPAPLSPILTRTTFAFPT